LEKAKLQKKTDLPATSLSNCNQLKIFADFQQKAEIKKHNFIRISNEIQKRNDYSNKGKISGLIIVRILDFPRIFQHESLIPSLEKKIKPKKLYFWLPKED
jgi:hypothetical protein